MCIFQNKWVRVSETYENIESVCSIGSQEECANLQENSRSRGLQNNLRNSDITMNIMWKSTHDANASSVALVSHDKDSVNWICLRVSEPSTISRVLADDNGTCDRIGGDYNKSIMVFVDIPMCKYIPLEPCIPMSTYQMTKKADGMSIKECADICYMNTLCDFFKSNASSCWMGTMPLNTELPMVGNTCMQVASQSSPTVYIPAYASSNVNNYYDSLPLKYHGHQCIHTGQIVSSTSLNPFCNHSRWRDKWQVDMPLACLFECAGHYENEQYDFLTIGFPSGSKNNTITCEIHAYNKTTLDCDIDDHVMSFTYKKVEKCNMDGYYVSADNQCQKCPNNTYNTFIGGNNRTGIDDCVCISGYMGSVRDNCVKCPENHYSNGGNTTCTKCPHNSESLSGSKNIDDCNCMHGRNEETFTLKKIDGVCMNVIHDLAESKTLECWAGGEWVDVARSDNFGAGCDYIEEANCSMSKVVPKHDILLYTANRGSDVGLCVSVKNVPDIISITSGEHPDNEMSCHFRQSGYEYGYGYEDYFEVTVMRRWYGCGTAEAPGPTSVVKITVDVPYTQEQFTKDVQKIYKKAIAATAGVAEEFVEIVKIERKKSSFRRRRLLSETVSVETQITVQHIDNANAISETMTPVNINIKMKYNGIPTVIVSVDAIVETTRPLVAVPCMGWSENMVSTAKNVLQKNSQNRDEADIADLRSFISHIKSVNIVMTEKTCLNLLSEAEKVVGQEIIEQAGTGSAGRCVVGILLPVLLLPLHLASLL